MVRLLHEKTLGSSRNEHGFIRVINWRIFTWNESTDQLLQYISAESCWNGNYIFTNLRWEKSSPMKLDSYITLYKSEFQNCKSVIRQKTKKILEEA